MNGDPLDELDEQGAEIKRLEAEVERLRLTDAEREALRYVCSNVLPDGNREGDDTLHTLRMMLNRLT